MSSRFLLGTAIALLVAVDGAPGYAQTTFQACRVPAVGAIYMINVAGAPNACLDASHVAFSWTEGGAPADGSITSAKIADGTIVAADLAAGAVTGVKIAASAVGSTEVLDNSLTADDFAAGAAGRTATTLIGSAIGIPTVAANLGSVSITAPTAGTVFIAVTGYAVTFGDNTAVVVGLGTATTLLDIHSVRVGVLDGTGTQRREFAFSPMSVVAVGAGTTTFYATAQVPAAFAAQTVNLGNLRLVAVFQPL